MTLYDGFVYVKCVSMRGGVRGDGGKKYISWWQQVIYTINTLFFTHNDEMGVLLNEWGFQLCHLNPPMCIYVSLSEMNLKHGLYGLILYV